MDRPTFLEEVHVELKNGSRQAVATLQRYEDGWVVHRVAEEGRPDVEEHPDVFESQELASNAAKKLWIV
ncbi:MAG: hypothetical protein EOP13_29460 [Pseudomonas sp.]|uniref:hypothetical protein n=1 Tax=Pseudomonas sp. TaxID=306 RepID=UPI00121D197A|nr:hypothetical protein [Pseudomonas sp.]RZI67047.1 MAG: hypothetical protein EOP13_29460 [Pseudomonas sp.]